MEEYAASIIGVLVLCMLSLLLAVYSGRAKGTAGVVSGPVLNARDDNKLYRIDRAHMNSVEALAPFTVPVVIAMLVQVSPVLLATLVWLHLALRLSHLFVYLRGGEAAKTGQLRTMLYALSALVALILIVVTGWCALT